MWWRESRATIMCDEPLVEMVNIDAGTLDPPGRYASPDNVAEAVGGWFGGSKGVGKGDRGWGAGLKGGSTWQKLTLYHNYI